MFIFAYSFPAFDMKKETMIIGINMSHNVGYELVQIVYNSAFNYYLQKKFCCGNGCFNE